ncbi:hypothetical protein [Streptomyces sp. NPDC048825]|uniref:hypothetical protein n=1 Tax=Streptomyces sp. NPDC048825 TaxID=3365592 RepID=UPI003721159A
MRWLLRAFCVSAAAFAARINYLHGAEQGVLVGWGLAAVTMLGPLFFEVRQWVLTLTADATDPRKRAEEKARAKHDRKRRRHHKDVVKLARQLVSAAPYGKLAFEEAFATAWEIKHGTCSPGMTPKLHAQLHGSRKALAATFDDANGSRYLRRPPQNKDTAFRVTWTVTNGTAKPLDLDSWSINPQGATTGGEVTFFYVEKGSKQMTGRLAPDRNGTYTGEYSLPKSDGTEVVVTAARMDDAFLKDDAAYLAEDPHWTGPIK